MYTNIPTYYPGDTLTLRLRFHHEVNLTDMWANFEKEEEVATLKRFQFTARLRDHANLRLLDWTERQMISEVVLEASVSKEKPLPGIYELSEVHGLPSGEERHVNSVLDFEIPKDIRFRIAAPPIDEPPKVTHWELGWEARPRETGTSA